MTHLARRPAAPPHDAVLFPVRLPDGEFFFYRPADPQAILDRIDDRAFGRDEHMPYWAEHWPAADAALAFLHANPLAPTAVACEIGCGLGVVTSLLARQCALAVGMDISRDGCRYAAANLAAAGAPRRVVCGDWRRPPFARRFEAIVAVDVLYEERWVAPVVEFVRDLLAEHGTALVVDPCRPSWPLFRERVRTAGLASALAHVQYANAGRTRVEVLRIVG
jgi:SAM-dependent methyltransferase